MVTCDLCGGVMTEDLITYTIQMDDRVVVVEHVPAKVCGQCGERLYAPETVERLQGTVWGKQLPARMLQTPVFDFAAKQES